MSRLKPPLRLRAMDLPCGFMLFCTCIAVRCIEGKDNTGDFMTAYPNLQTDVLNNPIAWREALGALRNRSKWFWRLASAATALLLISPVFYGYFYFWQSLS